MVADPQTIAERDVTWLAIRHPAVIRLLERELGSFNGDAFAAGLELAWSLVGDASPWGHVRIDHAALAAGMAAVRFGSCDTDRDTRALVRSFRDQLDDLPLVLSNVEQDAVVTVLAAVAWATLAASGGGLDDTLLA